MKYKRIISIIVLTLTLISILCVGVNCENVYSYDLSKGADAKAEGSLGEFIESIPESIRDELPESREDVNFEDYDFEFFAEKLMSALKKAVSPAFRSLSLLSGTVIAAAVFNIFATTVAGDSLKPVFSFCATLCISLCIFGAMETLFDTVDAMLGTLSDTMLLMIPVMETIYISSGNLTTAAVTSTGVNLMIGFTETVFADLISPGVYIAFFLSVVGAVTNNKGIGYMVKLLRGLITGGIITVMTVMSFVLSLQTAGASAVDSLATRTVKYAICTYLPLVGGTVADSFSVLSGSMGVIKQGCGITGIAVIIIAFSVPMAILLLNRIAIGISGALASVMGCEKECALLEECKGICTMLIAVSVGGAVIYIIALGIFCKVPIAVG